MLSIDASAGGGQILRTSLALAVLLQKPFEMTSVRAGRPKPGLQMQHLTAVNACAQVSEARLEGAVLGSQKIVFDPRRAGRDAHGIYRFDTTTAGSTMLVLQSLLPALAFSKGESKLVLVGGTSNPFAPTSWFVQKSFLPAVARMGVEAELEVENFGYYPKGGGVVEARVQPLTQKLRPLSLAKRGALKRLRGFSVVSNIPASVAERMKVRALKNLGEAGFSEVKIELVDAPSVGQGAEFFLLAEYENSSAGFTALGELGKPAEKVAGEAVHAFKQFHSTGACVELHLADQLLLYAALAEGKSEYSVSQVSAHLLSNAWAIRQFLPECKILIQGNEGVAGSVLVEGVGFQP